MPTFVLSDEAEIDIAGISEYISERNLAAGIEMLDHIESTCQMLAENSGLAEERQGYGVPGCRSFTVSPETAPYTSVFQRIQARGQRKNARDRADGWMAELTLQPENTATHSLADTSRPAVGRRTWGFCRCRWIPTGGCSIGPPG